MLHKHVQLIIEADRRYTLSNVPDLPTRDLYQWDLFFASESNRAAVLAQLKRLMSLKVCTNFDCLITGLLAKKYTAICASLVFVRLCLVTFYREVGD